MKEVDEMRLAGMQFESVLTNEKGRYRCMQKLSKSFH